MMRCKHPRRVRRFFTDGLTFLSWWSCPDCFAIEDD